MKEEVIATKPRIKITPKGKWYIYFSIRNPKTGLLEPFKVEKGFSSCSNNDEKQKYGEKLIEEYTDKIKRGWTPWNNEEVIYQDEIMYHNESVTYGTKRKKSKATIRAFSSQYLLYKRSSVKSKTYSSYQTKIRIFVNWLEVHNYANYDITSITNDIIIRFFEEHLIQERNLDKITIKGYKMKINQFFEWLKNSKVIRSNPVYNIPTGLKKCDNAPRPILPGDIDELLNKIESDDPQLYLACLMQFFCAIRPGTELRLLKIKNIDFWNDLVRINILDSKMQREEQVTIPKQLKELITNTYHLHRYNKEFYVFGKHGMPGDTPLGKNTLRNRFNKYRDELKLSKDYKFYSFKHTGANMMLDSGSFTIRELMDHLRHTDIESTYHYIRKQRGNSSDKVKQFFPDPRTKH